MEDNGASSYHRFLEGDDNGIVDIVKRYKDGLILYLNQYVSDLHLAEDLAEDTFFKLMVKKPRYTNKYTFQAWLYAIGRNLTIDYIRKRAKIFNPSDDDLELFLAEKETLEKSYIRDEQKLMVRKALGQLKPEYRQIIWLVYFEDFTNGQAAKIIGKTKHEHELAMYENTRADLKMLLSEGKG